MTDDSQPEAETVNLQFHYIKGPDYREVPCHGAIGGLTPQGKIWLALFSERGALPRIVQYSVPSPPAGETRVPLNERTATPSFVETRSGIIRHVEFSTYLDIETAQRLRDWLDLHISQINDTSKTGRTRRQRRGKSAE